MKKSVRRAIMTMVMLILTIGAAPLAAGPIVDGAMVRLPGGLFQPLIAGAGTPQILVRPFRLDVAPVTNQAFAEFVARHPQWAVERVPALFAEPRYLRHWPDNDGPRQPAPEDAHRPVVNVSWFAARAYCSAQGKRLPTIAEWEFAGRASATLADGSKEKDYVQRILDWYAQPASNTLPFVMQSAPNYWGIYDMHGAIWEWTQDFNASGALRAPSSNVVTIQMNDRQLQVDVGAFCGAAAVSVANPSDYAAFMRYSFRNSLKAPFVLDTLGFRCAADDAD